MVRRRRNNPTWGTLNFDPLQSVCLSDEEREDEELLTEMNGFTLADQLMMCWGVGPSKVMFSSKRAMDM